MTVSAHRTSSLVTYLLAAVVAALLLVGCGGEADEGDEGAAEPSPAETEMSPTETSPGEDETSPDAEAETATFVAVDVAWDEAPDQVPAGQVTLVLENQGNLPHTLAMEDVQGGEPLVESSGGETNQTTLQLEPGTYTYYCTVGTHRAQGMEGTLEVTE